MMQDKRLLSLIKKAELKVGKTANQILSPYGLTYTQLKILLSLYDNPNGSLRQVDLEEAFSLTNPTVTGILDNLEKKNLICRVRNSQDKRSKRVALTVLALRQKEDLCALAGEIERRLTAPLSEDEQFVLAHLLAKLLGEQKT